MVSICPADTPPKFHGLFIGRECYAFNNDHRRADFETNHFARFIIRESAVKYSSTAIMWMP